MDAIEFHYATAPSRRVIGLAIVVRQRRLIALSGALFLTLGLLFVTLKAPTFTASTQLLVYVREVQPGPETVILPGRADVSVVQNQIEVIQSRNVLLKVVDALNLKNDSEFASNKPGYFQVLRDLFGSPPTDMSEDRLLTNLAIESLRRKIAVRRVGTSHTVTIAVTASDPTKAARIANEIAQVYLQERAGVLEGALSKSPLLRERLQGLGPNAYVISSAEPPIKHDGPRSILIIFASGFLGLGAGVGLALLLDFTDRKIHTSDQAESIFGVECFGAVPLLRQGNAAHHPRRQLNGEFPNTSASVMAWVAQHRTSPFSQTLRRVRAALHDSSVRALGITSVVVGEGATTISANLAHLMALSGKRVLLVDCSPGNLSLSRLIELASRLEFASSSKADGLPLSRVVTNERTGFDVFLPNDVTVLTPDCAWHAVTDDFIGKVSQSYDLVIVDLPPLASGAEVRAAARTLDAFLLVSKWNDTDAELAQRAMRSCGTAQEKFIGVVLNMVDEQTIRKDRIEFSFKKMAMAIRSGWLAAYRLVDKVGLRRHSEQNASS